MNVKRVKELLNELANECESERCCNECPLEMACINELQRGFWTLSEACDSLIDRMNDECKESN